MEHNADSRNILSASDVCLILDACSRTHARTLKFAGLEVEFGPSAENVQLPPVVEEATAPTATLAERAISDNDQKAALEKDERDLREEQLEYLRITDPAAYEKLHVDGELGEADAPNSDNGEE